MLTFPAFFGQHMTARHFLRTAKVNCAGIAARSSSARVHGFAYFSSGRPKREIERQWKNSDYSTPQARCLLCTILIPDPSQVGQAEVIKSLPSLMFPFHRSLRNLTFFITPEFIKWFDEGNDFMQKALSHMHQDWSAFKHKIRHPIEGYQRILRSRVAVVDRIPFPDGNSSGCAGISLAVTTWSSTWSTEIDRAKKSSTAGVRPREVPHVSVQLPFSHKKGGKKNMRMLLRPANTLFVNGLESTMFMESWVLNDEAGSGPKFLRHTARESLDRIPLNHVSHGSSLTAPLQRLTETREVSMCMGNIISKLVGSGDAEPTSASLELEKKVSAFMKSKEATSGTLNVFALITPKIWHCSEHGPGPVVSSEMLGYHETAETTDVVDEEQRTLNSIRLAISNGAHLHRVTSGGGGWGKKQGLLSLEPAVGFDSEETDITSLRVSERFEESLETDGPIWGQHTQEVARPGDMVEFYGIFWSKEEEEALIRRESLRTASKVPDVRRWVSRTWADKDVSNVVWGVIPPLDSNGANTVSTLGSDLITVPHHFGMLSERGMVLQRIDHEIDKQAPGASAATDVRVNDITRIDVPHTSLTYSIHHRRPAQMVLEQKESKQNEIVQPKIRYTLGLTDVTSEQQAQLRKDKEAQSPRPGKTGIGRVFKYIANSIRKPTQAERSRADGGQESVRIVKYNAPVSITKHNAGR